MNMNRKSLSFFTYGTKVQIKIDDKPRNFVMILCNTNHSFIEFVNISTLEIQFYINIYHVKNVRVYSEKKVIIRLKDHSQTIKLTTNSSKKALSIKQHFENFLEHISTVQYCEYSLKNLIRYVLYYTKLAKVEGIYSSDSIDNMLKRMHVFYDKTTLNKIYKKSIKNTNEVTVFDFRRVFKILFLKPEFSSLFKKLLKIPENDKIEKQFITIHYFYDNFVKSGKSRLSFEQVESFFDQIERPSLFLPNKEPITQVDFEMFTSFLFSPLNQANQPIIETNLEGNLCNFYIGTCLRPELVNIGNEQKVKLDGIEIALENSARFIEICCYDGPEGRPVLSNSTRFKSKISMQDALLFIHENAFRFTDAPLILGLELHCSKAQRIFLGKLLLVIFGDSLLLLTKDSFSESKSPKVENLKNKILIKCTSKYPAFIYDCDQNSIHQVYSEAIDELDNVTSLFEEISNENGLKTVYGIYELQPSKFKKISGESVLSEGLADHHKNNLCYADSTKSDDISITTFWNWGIQFVSVNPQIFDENSFISKILFERNGKGGFIEKPESLVLNKIKEQGSKSLERKFNLNIISGQILHSDWKKKNEQFFPYVRVKVLGTKIDMKNNQPVYTCIDELNPFHCVFEWADGAKYKQFELFRPDLDLLIFEVINAKTEQIIKRGLVEPKSMLEGLKSVTLYDAYNHFDSFSYLVVEIVDFESLVTKINF